jgi:hypothetical protein
MSPAPALITLHDITIEDYSMNNSGIINISDCEVDINYLNILNCSGEYSGMTRDTPGNQIAYSPLTIFDSSINLKYSIFKNNYFYDTDKNKGGNPAQAITVFNSVDSSSSLLCYDTSFIIADWVTKWYINTIENIQTRHPSPFVRYWNEDSPPETGERSIYRSWPMIRNFDFDTYNLPKGVQPSLGVPTATLLFNNCHWILDERLSNINFMYFLVDQQKGAAEQKQPKIYQSNNISYINCSITPGWYIGGAEAEAVGQDPSWNKNDYWVVPYVNTFSRRKTVNAPYLDPDSLIRQWKQLSIYKTVDSLDASPNVATPVQDPDDFHPDTQFNIAKAIKFNNAKWDGSTYINGNHNYSLRLDPDGLDQYIPFYSSYSKGIYQSSIFQTAYLGTMCNNPHNPNAAKQEWSPDYNNNYCAKGVNKIQNGELYEVYEYSPGTNNILHYLCDDKTSSCYNPWVDQGWVCHSSGASGAANDPHDYSCKIASPEIWDPSHPYLYSLDEEDKCKEMCPNYNCIRNHPDCSRKDPCDCNAVPYNGQFHTHQDCFNNCI